MSALEAEKDKYKLENQALNQQVDNFTNQVETAIGIK
jgi:cell division protein FtsB